MAGSPMTLVKPLRSLAHRQRAWFGLAWLLTYYRFCPLYALFDFRSNNKQGSGGQRIDNQSVSDSSKQETSHCKSEETRELTGSKRNAVMTQFDKTSIHRQRPLSSYRPMEKFVKGCDLPVKDLIRERRRISLVYRRSQTDDDHHKLADLDHQLAGHGIDIPAVQRAWACG